MGRGAIVLRDRRGRFGCQAQNRLGVLHLTSGNLIAESTGN